MTGSVFASDSMQWRMSPGGSIPMSRRSIPLPPPSSDTVTMAVRFFVYFFSPRSMGQVLAISGTVIPVTTTDVRLTATFENGAYVVGESNIFGFKKQQDCRIDHVELLPAHPKARRL